MPSSPVPVFVVSLARAPDRRAEVTAHLDRLGVAHRLLDAVDGQLIPPERRREMQAEGVDYHPGVLGCYLSHMEIYRRMVAEDLPVALCFEDDARLNPAFAPALRQGLSSLDFDYCFLDYQSSNEDGPVYFDAADGLEVFPGFTAFRTHAGPATTHAYLITRAAAERRLAHEFPIRKPVDIYSTLPYRPRFRALVAPRGAGVSEASLRSFTSGRDHTGQLSFRALRRLPGFYALRDALSLEMLRRRLRAGALVRAGALPGGGRWRPLPPGRRVFV